MVCLLAQAFLNFLADDRFDTLQKPQQALVVLFVDFEPDHLLADYSKVLALDLQLKGLLIGVVYERLHGGILGREVSRHLPPLNLFDVTTGKPLAIEKQVDVVKDDLVAHLKLKLRSIVVVYAIRQTRGLLEKVMLQAFEVVAAHDIRLLRLGPALWVHYISLTDTFEEQLSLSEVLRIQFDSLGKVV